MNPERWKEIERLYHTALEREADGRDEFLAAACAGDDALRREVESLLQFHDRADHFIEAPALEIVAQLQAAEPDHSMSGQLGPYQIIALIGAGGMGEVYRALDTRLEREVAIKVLPPFLAEDPQALAWFKREAKAVAALSHPNILAIHDFGTEQGTSFAVMELLEGETLRTRLGRAALPWRKAVKFGTAIAEGLAAAHDKGITHRDLKPENIFLTLDGQVKILDFGIAQMQSTAADAESRSASGDQPEPIIGTINYMSPEQLRGETVEATSDIFSSGCVLYEMVTGRRPFERSSAADTRAAIMEEDPPPLGGTGKEVPSQLEEVVKHCLEKEAGERFQSARDMAFALQAVMNESRESGRFLSSPAARFRRVAWGGIALFVLLAAFVIWRNLTPAGGGVTSLAILPMVNESADPNMEYLADGIPESIDDSLSQLPNLKVISYSSVIAYRGQNVNPQTIGRQLGVGALLLGRIAQRGDEISVSAEMVDVGDSHLLWGKQYHRRLADLFVIQEEIAKDICDQLRVKLTNEERRQLTRHYTENAEAYQLYLKGRYYWNKREPGSIQKGIEYFEQAISKDPEYALAYAGLADSYAVPSSGLPAKERLPKANDAARKALALDDTLAEAHASLGYVKYRFDWDWPGAEEEFKRAIALNPSYATAYEWYGLYLGALGRFDEAMAQLKRAQEFDPNSPIILVDTAITFYGARQYDQAIAQCRQALELDPNFRLAHQYLGRVYEQKKQYADAVAEYSQWRARGGANQEILAEIKEAFSRLGWKGYLQKALSLELARSKTGAGAALTIAELYARLKENDEACRWLEQAFQEHDDRLVFLNADPRFQDLKQDPRFDNLVRRVGLSPRAD